MATLKAEGKLPGGTYFIGDPCYMFNESCSLEDGVHEIFGHKIFTGNTCYGDWVYQDNFGNEYEVDAGLLGALPIALLDVDKKYSIEELKRRGRIFEMKDEFYCSVKDGKFVFGHVVIDTDYLNGEGKPPWSQDCQPVLEKTEAKKRKKQTIQKKESGPWLPGQDDFTLTKDEVKELCSSNCYHCNSEPTIKRISKNRPALGIDRIDQKKGYTAGNVIPCCMRCKYIRGNKTLEEFHDYVRKVANDSEFAHAECEKINQGCRDYEAIFGENHETKAEPKRVVRP